MEEQGRGSIYIAKALNFIGGREGNICEFSMVVFSQVVPSGVQKENIL